MSSILCVCQNYISVMLSLSRDLPGKINLTCPNLKEGLFCKIMGPFSLCPVYGENQQRGKVPPSSSSQDCQRVTFDSQGLIAYPVGLRGSLANDFPLMS